MGGIGMETEIPDITAEGGEEPALFPLQHPTLSPSEAPALSPGERVECAGAFTSRRGTGEGSLPEPGAPPHETKKCGNELNDMLQASNLSDIRTENELALAPNELASGVGEPTGPVPEPTPHPSCSGWRKRRRTTPSPQGRGLSVPA